MIRAFGVLNQGSTYNLPHPITYVIDANGTIRHRFSKRDYQLRPDIDLVLSAIAPR